ncbi:MAG: hypothetical protein ABI857_11195 [Acidobacteriota bacterium]
MPAKTADEHTGPSIDFTTPGKALDVKVQLDKKRTSSGRVSPSGGSVSLTSADGSKFTLDVPPNALETETEITMTAVKSLDGAPLDNNRHSGSSGRMRRSSVTGAKKPADSMGDRVGRLLVNQI